MVRNRSQERLPTSVRRPAAAAAMRNAPQCRPMDTTTALPIDLSKLNYRRITVSADSAERICVPIFLYNAFKFLAANDYLQMEGIFRKEGNKMRINAAEKALTTGEIPEECTVLDVCVLVKRFFQRIPDGIFGAKEQRLLDFASEPQALFTVIQQLRQFSNRYGSIVFILTKLADVVRQSEANKMTLENISRVFAPCMFRGNTIKATPRRSRSLVRRFSETLSSKLKEHTALMYEAKANSERNEKVLMILVRHRHLIRHPVPMFRDSMNVNHVRQRHTPRKIEFGDEAEDENTLTINQVANKPQPPPPPPRLLSTKQINPEDFRNVAAAPPTVNADYSAPKFVIADERMDTERHSDTSDALSVNDGSSNGDESASTLTIPPPISTSIFTTKFPVFRKNSAILRRKSASDSLLTKRLDYSTPIHVNQHFVKTRDFWRGMEKENNQ